VSNHSRRESLEKCLESAPSLAKDLQVWFAVPVGFIGCLFCLCFEVWICDSDDDEPLKDLSTSRNWEDFYFFFIFFCFLGGTLLSGLDVLLGLAYS